MLTKGTKTKVIKDFQKKEDDTGSANVVIALISKQIDLLAKHLQNNKKDRHSRLGLVKLVEKRRKNLSYLQKHNPSDYQKVTKKLGLKTK